MRVCHSLIFFFLTLRNGRLASSEKDIRVRTGAGGNITVGCTFTFSRSRKVFCRGDCEDGDILVETSGVSNQRGRYSIECKEGNYPLTTTMIYVSITNLTKSDSGRYSCELGRSLSPAERVTFELRVTDDPTTSTPNWTLKPSTSATPSAPRQTGTPSTAAPAPASASHLYVRLVLGILIMVSSSAVLIFCTRKRRSQAEDPHVELDYVNVTEGHQVYEEVGEEQRRGRSPPEETS
ncbi:uncharacterized protein LOC141799765 isoform X2 [Halichoeres trimaculatus]|uniref:uncharacterized protein LOC141799765 isoform X2 n=1 Tax=Halichoeres trimaculatus TaxID=147232 RepID=UPI003D9DDB43